MPSSGETHLHMTGEGVESAPQTKPKKKRSTKKKVDPATEFSKKLIGNLTTFFCTHSSGTEKVDGIPVSITPDPDGRHVIEFFSEDGVITFLYLDQVVQFVIQPVPTESHNAGPYYEGVPGRRDARSRPRFDMREEPPYYAHEYAGADPTYNPYPGGGQPVDEVYYSAGRRGPVVANTEPPVELRRTERIE